LYEGLEFVQKI